MDQNTCPICGGKFRKDILMNNPPYRSLKCSKCGRTYDIPREHIPKIYKNGYRCKT